MFKELVLQCKRLFKASKNNAKLVKPLVYELHFHKQMVIMVGFVFLLGASQFSKYFECQTGNEAVRDLCWINGTTTVVRSEASSEDVSVSMLAISCLH